MDETEDIGVHIAKETQHHSVADSRQDTTTQQLFDGKPRLVFVEGEHLADDALVLVMPRGHPMAVSVHDIDEVALLRMTLDMLNSTREYPRMATKDRFLLGWCQYQLWTAVHHCFSILIVVCGSSDLKTALPATNTSAPASKSKGALLVLTPPSTSIRHLGFLRSQS